MVVTAAAAGIGLAVARAFKAAGATVRLCDADAAAVERVRAEPAGEGAEVVDLRDGRAIDGWLDSVIGELGGVDVLVNNAGVKGPTAMVEEVAPEEWDECLAVSLDSHFRCIRAVAPVMKQQGSGSIINISSTAGLYGYGMRTPYAAAKWAVVGLTKSVAVELGPHGVRCNCVCPGTVRGERMDRVITAEAECRGVPAAEVQAEYLSGQSIARWVEPEEIAAMCLFLASPAAAMVSGQAIAVDGHPEAFHL